MNNRFKNTSVWVPLALAVALVGGMWIGKSFMNTSGRWDSKAKLETILGIIDSNYVDDVDADSLLEASLPGLLSRLDPTRYISPHVTCRVSTRSSAVPFQVSASRSTCSTIL